MTRVVIFSLTLKNKFIEKQIQRLQHTRKSFTQFFLSCNLDRSILLYRKLITVNRVMSNQDERSNNISFEAGFISTHVY